MKTVLINGIVLDGTKEMEPQKGLAIVINGKTIEKIAPQDKVSRKDQRVIDLAGQYVMPGLINLHVHLPAGGRPSKKQRDSAKAANIMMSNALLRKIAFRMCQGYARQELMSGVTTIRTVGGIRSLDSELRDRINEGKAVGPRILASNEGITVEGGHMAGSVARAAHSKEEAVALVEAAAAQHPDLIKLMITGGVLDATKKGEPGVLKMPPEWVKAACQRAHELGFSVAAHVESPQGVKVALENGVDTIEHGAKPDAEILRLFHETGAKLVTTLSPALPYALFDPSLSHCDEMGQYNGKIVFEGIRECAIACLEEGIPVGLGTDVGCPFITHYDTWREAVYFHNFVHASEKQCLYTLTLLNARIAGIDQTTGSLEEGKEADLIVLEGNPLEDLTVLRAPSMVMTRGKLLERPKVRRNANIDKALDPYLTVAE